MAYSYRWQYCDIDFLRHCLKQYSLLLEKIPSAILTEETTGTQMFVTGYLPTASSGVMTDSTITP